VGAVVALLVDAVHSVKLARLAGDVAAKMPAVGF